ncbi:MAG TPA: glycosyltransferase family 4 protein [Acidimicrobiales bacterium]|nr:glycosyltransferase family 4 protein [Acidimicrobiales bacterium]
MRIAVIAPPWTPVPPALYGGIELVVDRLANGFHKAGHDVLLFTTGDSTCPVPRAWALEEAEHQRIGMVVPELRHIMAAYDAVQDYDIVHDHTVMGPVYAQRFPDLHVVTTVHGPFNHELSDLYGRMAADGVPLIGISHAQSRPVPDIPIARVIHHGLDADAFPVGKGEGGYYLFLGRMSPDKGAHRATEICYKAGVPLLMAAKMREPWEHEYFDANVRPYLNDQIRYLGEVAHEEKIDLLANARGLIFPIRWNEPFGMVMLEAMACGTPVLAFPEGAAPEVVEHGKTGFLCADEGEMIDAIGRIDEIDRADCRASVEGYFSADRMVAEHVELFTKIVSG